MRSYTPVVPSKTNPIPDQNGQSLYPFSDQKGPKTPTRGVGTYLYGLYKGVPPPREIGGDKITSFIELKRKTVTRGKDYNREERLCIAWDVYAYNRLS